MLDRTWMKGAELKGEWRMDRVAGFQDTVQDTTHSERCPCGANKKVNSQKSNSSTVVQCL